MELEDTYTQLAEPVVLFGLWNARVEEEIGIIDERHCAHPSMQIMLYKPYILVMVWNVKAGWCHYDLLRADCPITYVLLRYVVDGGGDGGGGWGAEGTWADYLRACGCFCMCTDRFGGTEINWQYVLRSHLLY